MMKVVDVSKWNKVTDWKKVKASGVDGVVIRAGYGKLITQKDCTFNSYYDGAKDAGLHIGAYWYSYAQTAETAKAEARVFMQAIDGKTFDLPVYMDIEEPSQVKLSKAVCTDIVNAFCGELEAAGYYAGVYSFDGFYATNLPADIGNRFTAWVARVENIKPVYCKRYDMWQHSWAGAIDGITGKVDVDELYKDFPTLIPRLTRNGYSAAEQAKVCITARIAGLKKSDAIKIADACQKLGMTVVQSEED